MTSSEFEKIKAKIDEIESHQEAIFAFVKLLFRRADFTLDEIEDQIASWKMKHHLMRRV